MNYKFSIKQMPVNLRNSSSKYDSIILALEDLDPLNNPDEGAEFPDLLPTEIENIMSFVYNSKYYRLVEFKKKWLAKGYKVSVSAARKDDGILWLALVPVTRR